MSQPFHITVEPHRDTILLAAHGEVDLTSIPALSERVSELVDAGFTRLVLDLRDVSFLDSSGLRAVLDARTTARGRDVGFALIAGPPAVQRVFALTGLDTMLEFVDPRTLR